LKEPRKMAPSLAQLRAMATDELIARHDKLATNTSVGTAYYLTELDRRESAKRERLMLRLTVVITVLTVVNVAAVLLSVLA